MTGKPIPVIPPKSCVLPADSEWLKKQGEIVANGDDLESVKAARDEAMGRGREHVDAITEAWERREYQTKIEAR